MLKRIRKISLDYIPTVFKAGLLRRAQFLYPLLKIEPSSSIIMITNRCNLRCMMCKQWRAPGGEELSTEDWKNIIKELKKNGIRNINFTGGEPLLRKDIAELIAYAVSNGFVVGLTTNGLLLDKKLMVSLIDAGLRSIALSIDALYNRYEQIRGQPGSFIQIEKAALLISQIRQKKRIDAYINFTLMNDTIKEFRMVKGFADSLGLPVAVCLLDKNSFIFNLEENKRNHWISERVAYGDLKELSDFLRAEKARKPSSLLLNFPMIDFISEYFKDPRQVSITCVSSQDRIIIDPGGNLLGGCFSMGIFGNIKDTPLRQLRKEKKYLCAKRNMFYKKCAGCSCGYQFNISCQPGLLIKDLFSRIRYSVCASK